MMHTRPIDVEHADLIHDISHDFYGKRMATCSSDQLVKIWDWQPNDTWKCTAQWRNHLGPVWRIVWGHPEFGQIVATCCFDRTMEIWEEISGKCKDGGDSNQMGESDHSNPPDGESAAESSNSNPTCSNWIKRARFVESRTSVQDIRFAPRHMGLQFACIDVGGFLRIYEARDVMNLSQWMMQFESRIGKPGSCLSWSESRLDTPLIAVGTSVPEPGVHVGVVGSNLPSGNYTQQSSAASPGTLIFFECGSNNQWHRVEDITGIDRTINDLAFAPHLGQSFQQLAVATASDLVILRIKPNAKTIQGNESAGDSQSSTPSYSIFKMATFNDHKGRVWRVSWNVTGSLLASSGDDGCVRLWQTNYLGHWQSVSVVQPGGPSALSQELANQRHLGHGDPAIMFNRLIKACPITSKDNVAALLTSNSEETGQAV